MRIFSVRHATEGNHPLIHPQSSRPSPNTRGAFKDKLSPSLLKLLLFVCTMHLQADACKGLWLLVCAAGHCSTSTHPAMHTNSFFTNTASVCRVRHYQEVHSSFSRAAGSLFMYILTHSVRRCCLCRRAVAAAVCIAAASSIDAIVCLTRNAKKDSSANPHGDLPGPPPASALCTLPAPGGTKHSPNSKQRLQPEGHPTSPLGPAQGFKLNWQCLYGVQRGNARLQNRRRALKV